MGGISANEELACSLKMQLCIRVWCAIPVLSGASQDIWYNSVCHRASQCVVDAVYALFILATTKIAGMKRREDVITLSFLVPLLGVAATCSGAKEQVLLIRILAGLSL